MLVDYGIVTENDSVNLIGPSKVKRGRVRHGKKQASEHADKELPHGLYTDGKRAPTLVRQIWDTTVAVPGGRGRGANRVITSMSNQMKIEDHFPVVGEPGGQYITHVTPADGTGRTLPQELAAAIRERGMQVKVVGMDGCFTNTGVNNGAIKLLEVEIGGTVQWVICGLHLNELLWWHILSDTDGVTKGPEKLSGPIGSTLHEDLWLLPVVAFSPIPGKVPELPEEVVRQMSRDQQLAYRYCWAV